MKTAVCDAGAVLCLAYYLVILLYAGRGADFAWFWLLCAAGLLVSGHTAAGRVLLPLMCVGFAVLLCLAALVVSGMKDSGASNLDYVIVEGAQVKGTEASRSLRLRLEKALAYAQECPDTVLILSGGQGDGEDISEAQCMYDWLTRAGIDAQRLILEDQSSSTIENLIYSDELTGCAAKPTGLITNNFHMWRSLWLARRAGYTDVHGLPAGADSVMQVHFIVREAAAIVYGYCSHVSCKQ